MSSGSESPHPVKVVLLVLVIVALSALVVVVGYNLNYADLLYENPRVVEIEFATFLNRLRGILDELRDREEATVSPIVETMASLVERNEDIDSFLLVSDMLQNTSLWNEYDGEATLSAEAIAECGRITRAGRVRDLYVFYIDRNIAAQSNGWPTDRWRVCLEGIETTTIN